MAQNMLVLTRGSSSVWRRLNYPLITYVFILIFLALEIVDLYLAFTGPRDLLAPAGPQPLRAAAFVAGSLGALTAAASLRTRSKRRSRPRRRSADYPYFADMAMQLRARAVSYRTAGWAALLALLVVVVIGGILFDRVGRVPRATMSPDQMQLLELRASAQRLSARTPDASTAAALLELTAELERAANDLAPAALITPTERMINTLGARLGLVVLMVLLGYLFVGVYRYQIRMSAYLDARADALSVVPEGNIGGLERAVRALAPAESGSGSYRHLAERMALEAQEELPHNGERAPRL